MPKRSTKLEDRFSIIDLKKNYPKDEKLFFSLIDKNDWNYFLSMLKEQMWEEEVNDYVKIKDRNLKRLRVLIKLLEDSIGFRKEKFRSSILKKDDKQLKNFLKEYQEFSDFSIIELLVVMAIADTEDSFKRTKTKGISLFSEIHSLYRSFSRYQLISHIHRMESLYEDFGSPHVTKNSSKAGKARMEKLGFNKRREDIIACAKDYITLIAPQIPKLDALIYEVFQLLKKYEDKVVRKVISSYTLKRLLQETNPSTSTGISIKKTS